MESDEDYCKRMLALQLQFIELCQTLRPLGATTVTCGHFTANFTTALPKPTIPGQKPEPQGDGLDRFPRR